MLPAEKIKELLDAVKKHKKPLYIFDDDPDGLCAFLLLYRVIRDGKAYCLKAKHTVTAELLQQAEKYSPDSIFVLDVPEIEQAFVNGANVPVYWIDHHSVQKMENAHYFNPRAHDSELMPTTGICWQATKSLRQEDIWIAATGIIADWFFDDSVREFQKQRPDLLPPEINTPEEVLHNSLLGTLARAMSFNLKGKTSEVNTSIKILTRIENPDEILKQTTARGRKIWKKHLLVLRTYEKLLAEAKKAETKDRILVFTYSDDRLSITNDLANELLYRLKDKIIVIGRRKSSEVRCSLRSPAGTRIDLALKKALEGIQGYGGGHEQACGAGIKEEDFERFIENLRKELTTQ